MSEHRKALEEIMRLCAASKTYKRRTQTINNVAMKALGMTASQRHEVHVAIFNRIGDVPRKERYLKQNEKAGKKFAAFMLERHGEVITTIAERTGGAA